MTFTLGGTDIGHVQSEEDDVDNPVTPFQMPNTDTTQAGSADTTQTLLVPVFKPIGRIKISGVKKFDNASDAQAFRATMRGFGGTGNNGGTFTYNGVMITGVSGLVENMQVRISTGALLVSYSFTLVQGVSVVAV